MSSVNRFPPAIPPVICDFGWGFGLPPARLPEFSYQINGNTYPPGMTKIGGGLNVTLPVTTVPTSFGSLTQLKNSFESEGTIVVDNGTFHDTVKYTGLASISSIPSFTGCTGGTHTFAPLTAIYDPRFYVDAMPLNALITFDAIDHFGLGLQQVRVPPGLTIVSYQWDFGNGEIGTGPFASTTYIYNVPPPGAQTTLTVTDSIGRTSSCAHRLNLLALTGVSGAAWRVAQSNLGYR